MQFLQLNLTPEQEARLGEIARRRRPRADSVINALRPTVQHMETEMMQEMLCALTPKQQEAWLANMRSNGWDPNVVAERYRPVQTHSCPTSK